MSVSYSINFFLIKILFQLKIKNFHHMWEISIRVLMNIRDVQNIYTDPEKREQWISVWPELLKKMVGLSDHNFTCVVYGPLQKFFDALPKSYYTKLLGIFEEIKKDVRVSAWQLSIFLLSFSFLFSFY